MDAKVEKSRGLRSPCLNQAPHGLFLGGNSSPGRERQESSSQDGAGQSGLSWCLEALLGGNPALWPQGSPSDPTGLDLAGSREAQTCSRKRAGTRLVQRERGGAWAGPVGEGRDLG